MTNRKSEETEKKQEMTARRETMADGRRYIIYYTFGNEKRAETANDTKKPEAENV